ncbi:LCP family protein [Ilumatobacter sp.]|uniref:LCP family protein n=1 Tax=Ilumatobacter sp. TaxID=1967498 RepID=UPI003B52C599
MQSSSEHGAPARPRRRSSASIGALLALGVAFAGALGITTAADRQVGDVDRIENLEDALVAVDGPAVNYLLIGSDSREGIDEGSGDFANTGGEGDVGGRRSDTIIVLRQEEDGNGAALLSLNRDLWVEQADTGGMDRINAAYNRGTEVLASTITRNYGIEINHVVDVGFDGFKEIVDTIGGTTVCFDHPTRDVKSGLDQPAGCNRLSGEQALALARSRTYQQMIDGEWQTDGTADIGRVERQQAFIGDTVTQTLQRLQSDPFLASELIEATSGSLRLDPNLDPLGAAGTLRKAFSTGLTTYTLPSQNASIDGKSVLTLVDGPETQAILDYFRGAGPLPPVAVDAEG